jgi:ATP-dependent DNA helicase RecG
LTRSQAKVKDDDEKTDESFAKRKKKVFEDISEGIVSLVVGTHALLGEKINFKNLGLVIVDEQHRFGVEQRKALKEKTTGNIKPHFLSMTATPIPRSLALTVYGDLDLSVINELPQGRKPIITRVVGDDNRNKAYDFIRTQIKNGRQAFVVCPLIEDNNLGSEKKSVLSEYEKLSKRIFPDLAVGYLHGKMLGTEKEEIMDKFKKGTIDVLVSTAVVEVGVDIPNASVMMIEGAERFGLAQLHQFRGRVGRSIYQSYCLVFSGSDSKTVLERLNFFEKNLDGFKLAEYDLSRRGPGEVYGVEQSGQRDLKLANLGDREIIKRARDWALKVAANPFKYSQTLRNFRRNYVVHWE